MRSLTKVVSVINARLDQGQAITLVKIKGHSGCALHARADELANRESEGHPALQPGVSLELE